MKTKYLLKIWNCLILITLFGCSSPTPPPTPPIYTYDEAIDKINSFKNEIVSSGNAVILKSFRSARAGEVWIYDNCMESIEQYSASPIEDFHGSDYSLITDPVESHTYEFHWESNWTQTHSIDADIKYELLGIVIKAATKNTEIHSLDFKLSFKEAQYIRVKNIDALRNEYENYLLSNQLKTNGNIIISALIKGKLYVEFKAYNENNQQVEFSLSANLNGLLEGLSFLPSYKYFNDKGYKDGYSIIEESGDNLTVFAIEYKEISSNVQNRSKITDKISEYCDNDDILISFQNVNGICPASGENIIDLQIESGATPDKLYLYWTNNSNTAITSFNYKLTIRNRFGQIVNRIESFVIDNISPGVTIPSGSIFTTLYGGYRFTLAEVDFELAVTGAKHGLDVICN